MFDNVMTSELKIHRQSPRRVTQSLLGGSVTYLRSNFNQLKRSALCRLILILHITQEAFYQNNRRTNQSAK